MKLDDVLAELARIRAEHGNLDVVLLRGCSNVDVRDVYVSGFQRGRLDEKRPEGLPVVWVL